MIGTAGQPDPELRAIVQTQLRLASPLKRYRAEPGFREVHGDVILLSYGPEPDAKLAAVLGPEPPARVFALADGAFGAGLYAVAVEVEAAPAMVAALEAGGWQLDEEEPALALSPLPSTVPPAPPELLIRPVETEAALDVFADLSGNVRRWVPSLAAATDPGVGLFVGYVGDEPVATVRFARCGDVADITGVTTAEAHRRRGYGTAMTWAAVAEAARRGCTAATLTATELGYPVYVRMGFVPVCTYRTYLPPAAPG